MSAVLAGPFAAVAGLLAVSGLLKLRGPGGRWRVLGAAEAVLGGLALAHGGVLLAAAVALAYTGFAGYLLATRPQDCGCFAAPRSDARRESVPVLHATLDVLAAVLAAAAAAAGVGPVSAPAGAAPLPVVAWFGLTALVAWLAHVAMTALPAALEAARSR